nr:hypothetical protein CFP56_22796 [Quercus suber]
MRRHTCVAVAAGRLRKTTHPTKSKTTETGRSLDCLYDLLSKFNVLEGSAELVLKPMTKGYSVKDMSTANATKIMAKAASGYD